MTVVLKNLRGRRVRSLLTVGGLAVAVAAVVALVGAAQCSEQAFLELYQRRGADLVVQRAGGTVQLSNGLDQTLGPRIAALPGVRVVIGSLMDMVAFEQANLFAVIVNGWPAGQSPLTEVTMVAGRRLQAGDKGKVMLGVKLAGNLEKKVGDKIDVYDEPFEVIGIFDSFSVFESGALWMLLEELQRLMDRPGQVTGYVIEVDKLNTSVDGIKRRIEALEPGLSVVPTGEFVRGIAQMRVVRSMGWVVSCVAFFVGLIGVSNTMIMSVFERRGELGTLRALGWPALRIVRLVLAETLILSLAGALLGSVAGWLILQVLATVPATAGLIDGRLAPQVVGWGFALALGVGLCGAAYPAIWAARLSPLAAMRR